MEEKVRDMVCGMEFDIDVQSGELEYEGKMYYFCSLGCKDKFGYTPEQYLSHEEKES
jgi:Cu+-exporting ATPase